MSTYEVTYPLGVSEASKVVAQLNSTRCESLVNPKNQSRLIELFKQRVSHE